MILQTQLQGTAATRHGCWRLPTEDAACCSTTEGTRHSGNLNLLASQCQGQLGSPVGKILPLLY